MKKAVTIELSADDRRSLESIVKARTSEIRHIEELELYCLRRKGKQTSRLLTNWLLVVTRFPAGGNDSRKMVDKAC